MTRPDARLSRRVLELAPSQTLALSARAKELKAQGQPVISFSVGEPDFTSPKAAGDGARAAIEAGQTHYPPVPGTPALRQAVVDRLQRDYGWSAEPGDVLVSNGGKHVLYNLFQVLLDPGDEVAFASPYWVSYPALVQLAGGRPVPFDTRAEEDFRLDPEAVESALGPRTRVLVLNSPCNPTGAVADPDDLEAVVKLALDKGLIVVSDEIYSGLVFAGAEHKSVFQIDDPRVKEQVVLMDGVSKTYAMTGWRVGYAVGPPDVIKAATKLQGQSTSGVCSIAQAAAANVLEHGQAEAQDMHAAFVQRRECMLQALATIPGVKVPQAKGAFYAFPDVSAYFGKTVGGREIKGSLELSEVLLDQAHIAAVPGSAFGADAHLRLSYALDQASIETGIGRMRELLTAAG